MFLGGLDSSTTAVLLCAAFMFGSSFVAGCLGATMVVMQGIYFVYNMGTHEIYQDVNHTKLSLPLYI